MNSFVTARRIFLAAFAAAVLYWAAPILADRVVSYTLVPVTSAECTAVTISRQTNGAGGTVILATFSFEIKDSTGAVRESAATSVQLSPAQRTSLLSFVNSVAVPQLNDEQDL